MKQFSTVEYLGCLLDETLSGREMALNVLKKVNGKLRFLYRQGKYLKGGVQERGKFDPHISLKKY